MSMKYRIISYTHFHHVENNDKQEFICHPDNSTNHNHTNQITKNSYLYYKQTNSLVVSIPKHTEVQHTHMNLLILNTIYLPTYIFHYNIHI